MSSEQTVFERTDDVTGDTYIDAWTNGMGDLHVFVGSMEGGGGQSVYIRNAEDFAKAILLKAAWS